MDRIVITEEDEVFLNEVREGLMKVGGEFEAKISMPGAFELLLEKQELLITFNQHESELQAKIEDVDNFVQLIFRIDVVSVRVFDFYFDSGKAITFDNFIFDSKIKHDTKFCVVIFNCTSFIFFFSTLITFSLYAYVVKSRTRISPINGTIRFIAVLILWIVVGFNLSLL